MILFSNLKAFAVPYTHRAYASVSPVLAHTCMSNLVSRMLPQTVKGIKWWSIGLKEGLFQDYLD